MLRYKFRILALFLLAILMFLASGLHGSYFCVSPWAGGGREAPPCFFGGLLGFTEQQKPAALAGRNSIWFAAGLVNLHLGIEADSDFNATRRAHPALIVDNLDEIVAACERAGLPTRADTPIANFRRTHVFDPFGNRIELMENTTP